MYPIQREKNLVNLSQIRSSVLSIKVQHADDEVAKVRAGSTILKDTVTSEFACDDILRKFETGSVKLVVSTQGLLCARNTVFPFQWIRTAKLAKGVHESNTILERVGSRLRVRVVKTIEKDGQIYLWFSEEVAALMRITFLRLENIQGQYQYKCHECDKVFENPNPLKVHIATSCDRYSMDVLYQRLSDAVKRLEGIEQPIR